MKREIVYRIDLLCVHLYYFFLFYFEYFDGIYWFRFVQVAMLLHFSTWKTENLHFWSLKKQFACFLFASDKTTVDCLKVKNT